MPLWLDIMYAHIHENEEEVQSASLRKKIDIIISKLCHLKKKLSH